MLPPAPADGLLAHRRSDLERRGPDPRSGVLARAFCVLHIGGSCDVRSQGGAPVAPGGPTKYGGCPCLRYTSVIFDVGAAICLYIVTCMHRLAVAAMHVCHCRTRDAGVCDSKFRVKHAAQGVPPSPGSLTSTRFLSSISPSSPAVRVPRLCSHLNVIGAARAEWAGGGWLRAGGRAACAVCASRAAARTTHRPRVLGTECPSFSAIRVVAGLVLVSKLW